MRLQDRDLKIDLMGEDVRLLHNEMALIGLDPPQDEADRALFGSGTQQRIMRFQEAHRLPITGIVDTETARSINAAVDAVNQPLSRSAGNQPPDGPIIVRPAPDASYTVTGNITSPDRVGVGGLRVLIVDKNVGGDIALAETKTDDRGHYSIAFSGASLRERTKPQPDLQARVFAIDRFLAASIVHYYAGLEEVIDVTLPANTSGLQSEHETLTTALTSHYKGALGDLKEDDQSTDVTYLANKSGWDARAVAMASLADSFSRASEAIHPAFYYALFRAGLPANPAALYQTGTQAVTTVWKQAIDQGVIPATLASQVEGAAQSFEALSASHALDARPMAGTSTLGELLTLSLGGDAGRQLQFSKLYTESQGDMTKFWDGVQGAFGEQTASRLKLDGQLSYLTLNNASVLGKLHAVETEPITSASQLLQRGYYNAEKWLPLLDADVPEQIPGETIDAKRANYAEVMAAQVRIAHPTAVVAEMARAGELQLDGGADVHAFLTEHDGAFELGVHPVEHFIASRQLTVAEPLKAELTKLQRVYQITPSDAALQGALKNNLHSAFKVTRYDRERFIELFAQDLGGVENAHLTWMKAGQVHNTVLNIAASYITSHNAPVFGLQDHPILQGPSQDHTDSGVIAYPTLEELFGSMDYCACDECRSVLSPAAYLVDLLLFTNDPDAVAGHNPQDVLLSRRPDLQHLPLTCENTNTPLPYIDLVNETLEYFVTNQLKLDNYTGHDTDGTVTAAELLANPEFVNEAAYATLQGALFPPPLPFHRPLETLRRYFDRFAVPLQDAMEKLRVDESLDASAGHLYGWHDILMEELKLSRAEHGLLTTTHPLPELFGYPSATPELDVRTELRNVKTFTRRLDITPDDLVEILKTRFVNPGSTLIPRLERLHLTPTQIEDFKSGALTDAALDSLLPTKIRGSDYGGGKTMDRDAYPAIKAWLRDNDNFNAVMSLLTIVPKQEGEFCDLGDMELRVLDPGATDPPSALDFVRLQRFIRLWKKLGLSIELTDKAITALYAGDAHDIAALNTGFEALIPRLGTLFQFMRRMHLSPARELPGLLACWSPIDTHGENALYRRLFLSASLISEDPFFADDGSGLFLTDPNETLLHHAASLRSAFNLTETEFLEIVAQLGFTDSTVLSLANASAVYRWGWLARKLRLSVVELRGLTRFFNLDPFATPDPANPPVMQLLRLVLAMREVSLKPMQALYLLWDQDVTGKASPTARDVSEFARVLRGDFAAVDNDFKLVDDPTGEIAQGHAALVYGADAANYLFGLLNETRQTSVTYTNAAGPNLSTILLTASTGDSGKPRLAYNDFLKQLSYNGVLTTAKAAVLQAVPGLDAALTAALDELVAKGVSDSQPFFQRFPDLQPLFNAYADDARSAPEKRQTLLEALLPQLRQMRKHQLALSAISAVARSDASFAEVLLNDASILHDASGSQPAVENLIALGTPGLSARFFFRDTATGTVDLSGNEPVLWYSDAVGDAHLPANTATVGAAVSGIWAGYLEAPETDVFKLTIESDATTITLKIDGVATLLDHAGGVWTNHDPLALTGGRLYEVELMVEKTTHTLAVRWQTATRPFEVIPSRYLYPSAAMQPLQELYRRFLKVTALAGALKLHVGEVAYIAASGPQIGGQPWLNSLPALSTPDNATSALLRQVLEGFLDLSRLKAALAPGDDGRLLDVLHNPDLKLEDGRSALLALTGWLDASLTALKAHFLPAVDLKRVADFWTVYQASLVLKALAVPAEVLLTAATNEPTPLALSQLQSALRARYDRDAWLTVLQPINDEMRALQRDALVAYILQQFSQEADRKHIDTADKLFEYFLMDVLMEPCMQTSRIRHALSSVQLFIERCLMNLEAPAVSPGSLNAKMWTWMERYRVWEANRKVFLWPENWLEPELRDDQSPFFKEAMSSLLQNDITDDAAAEAFQTYLTKLQEVAKLEPCGLWYDESKHEGLDDDIAHVVARTSGGAHRKYYYRRNEYGYWTPWDEIKLDIEDVPVTPVVWQGRTLLFWLKLIKSAPPSGSQVQVSHANDKDTVASLKLSTIKQEAHDDAPGSSKVNVSAVLCWSEYFNGKWQSIRTSDVERPMSLTRSPVPAAGPGSIDRTTLSFRFWEEDQPLSSDARALRIKITGNDSAKTWILHSPHSQPVTEDEAPRFPITWPPIAVHRRGVSAGEDGDLVAWYQLHSAASGEQPWMSRPLLNDRIPMKVVEPQYVLQHAWVAPFLVDDSRHAFYVTTSYRTVKWSEFNGYGRPRITATAVTAIPNLVFRTPELIRQRPEIVIADHPWVVDPGPLRNLVSQDAFIHVALGTAAPIRFGGKDIGVISAVPDITAPGRFG